ncbi:DUF1349 domain-containing protein [Gloeocapsopsis dulcis]|uniref:DUF1349 domain-containing protein n=1 Tax=Gloeocapsopsis dulcis AAB1 = 1H9 TaxID=1433147 RepID=A0A6N8FQ92_9CHRO|nr:DUF1349 domain-containing protein [Gloeocapsopsis dulcis]MUL35390.1 hypothetical protein [Gloeocapsopsis dulcis AAB1 = 1H9]WNN90411.1 DUF1349 domain-containing protein [Gloeocapsopsis dulcis]
MKWLNEPAHWSSSGNQIIVNTLPKTDFWRVTHYGFIRDNGHFYYDQVNTDFVVEVEIHGEYKDLYDQAGIMVRSDENHWIKTGIEYVEGLQHSISAVVTHNYSDWSVTPLLTPPPSLRLRVERRKEAIHIFYVDASLKYSLLRLAYFPTMQEVQVGIMCASPEGSGYQVVFDDYRLTKQPAV